MTRFLPAALLAISLMLHGCRESVDVASEQQAILDTDRAFAAAAAAGDMDRVFSYWTDDAVIYPAGMPAVRGKDAIREFSSRNRAQPGFAISWVPRQAPSPGTRA